MTARKTRAPQLVVEYRGIRWGWTGDNPPEPVAAPHACEDGLDRNPMLYAAAVLENIASEAHAPRDSQDLRAVARLLRTWEAGS